MGAGTVITHGKQLPVGGTQNQVTSTTANVGPNALLASGSYPLPTAAGTGPLTSVPLPSGHAEWRITSPSNAQFTPITGLWTSPTAAYVYNNVSSNLGGIVGGAGATIDGYPVTAGTYVFQFMDFCLGCFIFLSDGPPVMFRGCRIRGPATSPGFFNSQSGSYASSLYFHFCDFGGAGSGSECDIAVQIGQSGNMRLLRNYISWIGSGFILVSDNIFCDVFENLIEDITLYNGALHLNGIKFQGGDTNFLIERNCVIFDKFDALGNQITQTDAIGALATFGNFPGTGVNSDGSTGYTIANNLVGGAAIRCTSVRKGQSLT